MVKNTLTICLLCILFYFQFKTCLAVCAYHPKCYHKCRDLVCEYDPLSNSFYNESLITIHGNNRGPRCCFGCAPQYSDHYFINQTGDCHKGRCYPGHDYSGNLVYYQPNWGCSIQCTQYGWYKSDYWYKNIQTRECSSQCSDNYFKDNSTMMCVETCPYGKYANPSTRQCQDSCNKIIYVSSSYSYLTSQFYYFNQYYRTCESVCSGPYFGDEDTRKCHQNCPSYKVKHYPTKMCVQKCPDGYFLSKLIQSCVSHCFNETGQFYNYQVDRCAHFCPYYYNPDNISGICLNSSGGCPPRMYKIQSILKCVKNCSVSAVKSMDPASFFHDHINMKCVAAPIPPSANYTQIQKQGSSQKSDYISTTTFIIVIAVGFSLILVIMGVAFYCQRKWRRLSSLPKVPDSQPKEIKQSSQNQEQEDLPSSHVNPIEPQEIQLSNVHIVF